MCYLSVQLKGGKLLHEPGKLPEQAALYAPLPSTNEAKKEKVHL